MRRFGWVLGVVLLVVAVTPSQAFARKKKEEAPPPIEFSVLRKGKPAGTFSYKVATFSGKYFSSSQLELNTGKGTLAIMTHVEKDGAGKLIKYRKWVGNEGARPDVIGFWNDDKLRIVSKINGKRFTRDLVPAKGFEVLDQLGFHLYGDLAETWAKGPRTSFQAVTIHKGRLDNVTLAPAGTAILKDVAGKEVRAQAVHLKTKSFDLTFFVGEKPRYLGFKSKSMILVRKGWNFLRLEAGEVGPEVAPAEPEAAAAETVAEEPGKGEEPETDAPEKGEPVKEASPPTEIPQDSATKDLPPLPE
jgi:hypothetical protein